MTPRSHPSPAPERPISRRLEDVRAHTGEPSIRAFHARLWEGWGREERLSYEAARKYHYDRDPPVAYLARVCEVFPEVRLEWLATGAGAMLEEDEEARVRFSPRVWHRIEQAEDGFLGGLMVAGWWGLPLTKEVRRRLSFLRFLREGHQEGAREKAAEDVSRALVAPIEALGLDPWAIPDRDAVLECMAGVAQALLGLLPASPHRPEASSVHTPPEEVTP